MENKNIIRFEFTKKRGLKYISHLDLQRAITRILKRSNIPVRYTQGFNPHPKLVFGLPLSVGCESECELLDVYMVMDEARPNVSLYSPEEFKRAIVPNLPDGLEFVNAYYPSVPLTDISTATYQVLIELNCSDDITETVVDCLSSPMVVFKKSKAGDKYVDISPMIKSFDVSSESGVLDLSLELSAAQNNFLNPELVMNGLKNNAKLADAISFYTVKRISIAFNGK